MGDYNALIISAKVKPQAGMTVRDFEWEISARLPPCISAYHATSHFVQVLEHDWCPGYFFLSMMTQAKYNRGVEEFLKWLEPMVMQGMGADEAWAINFSEYSRQPRIEYLQPPEGSNAPNVL